MKRTLLFITAILLMLTSCKENIPEKETILFEFTPYYRAPLILNGQVESMKVRTYWAEEVDGKIEKGDIITRIERDSLGYMSDFNMSLNEDGIVSKLEYITYKGIINHYEYEIKGNMIVNSSWYVAGEPMSYVNLVYDELGNNTERYAYRVAADTLTGLSKAKYNANGNLNEVSNYNHKEVLTSKWLFDWKDSNLVSEFHIYDTAGELSSTMKIFYDENNNYSTIKFDSPDRGVRNYELKELVKDEMGNIISSVTYKNGELFSVSETIIEYYQIQ